MNRLLISVLTASIWMAANGQINNKMKKEPTCKIEKSELTHHGHTRIDNYFWMKERDSKDVLEYIQQENHYSEAYFSKLEPLRNIILDEFEATINPNDLSAPFRYNHRTYQERSVAGKDYTCIFQIDEKKETLFFDENTRAQGKSYYGLSEWVPSLDNELLAISEDFIGRRKYTISFLKIKNQKYLSDKIMDTDGSIVWANDNKTIFYIKRDPRTLREFQVYKHVLGTHTKTDELVYEEKDERFIVMISKSLTNQYIELHSQSSTTSEIRLIDANKVTSAPVLFLAREAGHMYSIDHHENGFYILSNHKAKNNQVLFSKTIPSTINQCLPIIEHDAKNLIENLLVLQNFIITEERTAGLQKIRITNISTKKDKFISFEEETYSFSLGANNDYSANSIFFHYQSMTTPTTVFDYNLLDDSRTLYFKKELLDKSFRPENYESKRIWATANDGAQIAISLVYKKGIVLKDAPLLLGGYGSYGVTIHDGFVPTRLALLNRGFVFAIAHIRGEKYLGEEWYEEGKFLKKKNTFTDFINAAEYLGMQGYCDKNRIYAQGGSAGGLLMGAVTNMAPYLWKGVIAQVPFVDVVSTMFDETIPLTVGEYEEWGNPNDEEYYWYMLNYSPYDNVKPMAYPAMYITTGYHDSQVQYWEPLKWVAKLRAMRTNDLPLYLDCDMDAGHGGGSGRTNERVQKAKQFAFLFDSEGITK
jgi:oligopeptidase B